MLRDEIARYSELSGNDGLHTPIGIIGAYLDGYEKGKADAEPRWIPVTERLPERNQICIVTDETRKCAYEYGFHDETYDKETGWTYLGHKIIAWMPLPNTWKGEADETD